MLWYTPCVNSSFLNLLQSKFVTEARKTLTLNHLLAFIGIGFKVIYLRVATYIAWCHWVKLEMTYRCIARVIDRSLIIAVGWMSSLVSKINMYISKFLRGRRREKSWHLLSKFRTKSSVNTSISSRFHPTVVSALKLWAASKEKSFQGFLTAGSIASLYVHK